MDNTCNHKFNDWTKMEYFRTENSKDFEMKNLVEIKYTGYTVMKYDKWVRTCLNCGYKEEAYTKPLVKVKKI